MVFSVPRHPVWSMGFSGKVTDSRVFSQKTLELRTTINDMLDGSETAQRQRERERKKKRERKKISLILFLFFFFRELYYFSARPFYDAAQYMLSSLLHARMVDEVDGINELD